MFMEWEMTVGTALLVALPILLLLRVPVAVALLTAGGVGYCLLNGWIPFLHYLKTMPLNKFSSHSLSVIPMFILMGRLAFNARLGRDLFDAAQALLGGFRGGVGMAAIGSCAAFGSICGSSLATASTMTEPGPAGNEALRLQRRRPPLASSPPGALWGF